jgi:hypothetical protein
MVSPNRNSPGLTKPTDVARKGFIHGLAFLPKQLVSAFYANATPSARMEDFHVAAEEPRTHADKGDAVAVPRIQIGLNLEDKAGEFGASCAVWGRYRFDPITGRRTVLQEACAEIVPHRSW